MSLKTLKGGMKVDSARLEYEMKLRGIEIYEMCEKIGMSRSSFYRKRNGKSEFTQGEIQAILTVLKLDSPMGIFFVDKVS